MKTIDTLRADFLKRHEWLLATARSCEVAICGGCAAAIVKGRNDYAPADLDLVTTKANALRFLDQINHFLIEKQVHYRVYVNSRNDFVPKPALAHFRVQTPFWSPVCLFVLPHDGFQFYRIPGGHLLQLTRHVHEAANQLTETDEKPRLANELIDDKDFTEEDEPVVDEPPDEDEELPEHEPIDPTDFETPSIIHPLPQTGSFRSFQP